MKPRFLHPTSDVRDPVWKHFRFNPLAERLAPVWKQDFFPAIRVEIGSIEERKIGFPPRSERLSESPPLKPAGTLCAT